MNARVGFTTAYQDNISDFRSSEASISPLAVGRLRKVRVPNHKSPWAQELKDRFDTLTALKKGWDGYNGKPVSFTCAQFAANLIENLYLERLPPPQLVPGSDGTLQLEWHINQYDLEIDVLAPYRVVATLFNHKTDKEKKIEIETDFTALADWVLALREDREGALEE